MKSKRKYIALVFCIVIFVVALSANFVLAQQGPGGLEPSDCPPGQSGSPCQLDNPAKGQLIDIRNFGDLLKRIINIFLYFAGGIAVLFLMVGGFQYVAARGNEEATEKAKKTITGAIIGIIIIVMAFAIVAIVNNLLTRNDIGGGTGGGGQNGTLQAGENCNADSECANGLVCVSSSPSEPKVCQ